MKWGAARSVPMPARPPPARRATGGSKLFGPGWPPAFVLTAHHADDQVETVLMRALAGSGPAGLAGMAARSGLLVRPLLPFRRALLAGYVRGRALPVWYDPANQNPRHLRSWLRGDALPMLRSRLPKVDEALLSVARQAGRDRAAWDAVLDLLPGPRFPRTSATGFPLLPLRSAGMIQRWERHV